MSTTILAFHRLGESADGGRRRLILERHGSMEVETLRTVLDRLDFDLVLGPKAARRLAQREYADAGRLDGAA
jgi:hypothetical protein